MAQQKHATEVPASDVPLMHLEPGERFWKFLILTQPGDRPGQRVEHRILSKEHADGTLEMVTYNAWHAGAHTEKRDILRVPSLSKQLYEQIVARIRSESKLPPDAVREVDLSAYDSIEDQVRALASLQL
ncbi:MAG: hypothetical protein ACUVX9_16210 [Anaerolineae bacterium]